MKLNAKANASKRLAEELNRITSYEVDEYVKITGEISRLNKARTELNTSFKRRLEVGAKIPTDGPWLLCNDPSQSPVMSWRDLAYHLCVQILRLPFKNKHKLIDKFNANAGEIDAQTEVLATLFMEKLDKENPREPQPKLTVKPNTEWIKLQESVARLKGESE